MKLDAPDSRREPLADTEFAARPNADTPATAENSRISAWRDSPTGSNRDAAFLSEFLIQTGPPAPGSDESTGDGGVSNLLSAPDRVTDLLIAAIVDTELSIPVFIACARALRDSSQVRKSGAMPELSARMRDVVEQACRGQALHLDPRTHLAISKLMTLALRSPRLSEAELAIDLGVDPSHLGRLIRIQTGLTFRQWRWAVVLRAVARQLHGGREQIRQIAYRFGYEHHSQLNREFRRMFGITPTEFRRLSKAVKPA